MNKEFLKMQKLAGLITEGQMKDKLNENFSREEIMDILNRNGIDEDYFEDMGGREVEAGSEEWMDVVSELTGKNAYDDSNFTEEDNQRVMTFIQNMEALGIEMV
jgi:hypothetical protein